MTEEKIARINELSRISKERALTEKEQEEQASLRKEYIHNMKKSLSSHLTNIHIQHEDGSIHPLKKKEEQ